ncbi:MAG TPA: 16S rRNA (guanine(966)-N(2))-methyltransferase RsmD [Gaiellaceae bacterium]|nr:16S rRNA (guanine(966)-N(2))-methyltransferase RsmD [Gaiellaceae bacterium]
MRIIAGSRKGARIFAPRGAGTRPTGDRVREAAFNLIGPGRIEEATVLDLFAGSGAMGLEALSRGAARATFVEADLAACQTINRNLDKLGLEGATVLRQDALAALRSDARGGTSYDLVLVDPPYRRFSSLQNDLIQLLPVVLAPSGLLVVETATAEEPDLPPLAKRTSRRYGSARLTLFEHADE